MLPCRASAPCPVSSPAVGAHAWLAPSLATSGVGAAGGARVGDSGPRGGLRHQHRLGDRTPRRRELNRLCKAPAVSDAGLWVCSFSHALPCTLTPLDLEGEVSIIPVPPPSPGTGTGGHLAGDELTFE